MLLQFQANPALTNAQGKTPIDLHINSSIRSLLYRFTGEVDQAPSVFGEILYLPGFVFDDLYWGLLLPIEGSLKLYSDKTSYI
jgi:hypothetical protein